MWRYYKTDGQECVCNCFFIVSLGADCPHTWCVCVCVCAHVKWQQRHNSLMNNNFQRMAFFFFAQLPNHQQHGAYILILDLWGGGRTSSCAFIAHSHLWGWRASLMGAEEPEHRAQNPHPIHPPTHQHTHALRHTQSNSCFTSTSYRQDPKSEQTDDLWQRKHILRAPLTIMKVTYSINK